MKRIYNIFSRLLSVNFSRRNRDNRDRSSQSELIGMLSGKGVLGLFLLLCLGTLFLKTQLFVNAYVTPKWFFAIFMGMALVLTVVTLFFSGQLKQLQHKSLFPPVYFIITILCVAQAGYGILQYFNIFPAVNGFRVTGSFDNPAGFAACLCAGLPPVFYSILKNRALQRWFTVITAAIIITAILLSGSRAGMAGVLAVCMALLFYKFPKYRKVKIILFLAALLLFSNLYFLKKDSADGRLLIWRCSWEMIKEKPVLGYGTGGFKANYMNFQAKYFEENPDSKFAMLADNVNSPFNEYISLITDYGFAGFAVFLIFCWFLWKSFLRCRHENIVRLAACCLLSIAVFAFFSYPLHYPFVWLMMILSIAVIIYKAKYPVKIPDTVIYPAMILIIPAVIFFGAATYQRMANGMLWSKIANQSIAGKTKQTLHEYSRLHKSLINNELFLYNYAVELNVAGHYEESLQIARECEQRLADYDLQLLMADNYEKLKQPEDAETRYRKASAMCPVKFMPLYRLAKLYDANGNKTQAHELARIILAKKIKIPSLTIQRMKNEMQKMIHEDKTIKSGRTTFQREISPEILLPP